MDILLLSPAQLVPAWRHWETEMTDWCRQRHHLVRTLQAPSLIKDAAYRASEGDAIEEQISAIGRWQRDQVLKSDGVILAADPQPDPGLAMLAGWAAGNGKPIILYHSDPRTIGEWGQPLDVLLTSMATASHGGIATSLEELHNLLGRISAFAGESRLLQEPPLPGAHTLTNHNGPKPVITFEPLPDDEETV